MTDIQKIGDDLVRSLSKAASENPLSAALIGAGALWMMAGATRPTLAPLANMAAGIGSAAIEPLTAVKNVTSDGAAAVGETARNVAVAAQHAIEDGSASIADASSDIRHNALNYAGEVYETAHKMSGSLKETLSQFFEEQPLALAAVGLAIGAGIAAAIPASNAEKEIMGETSGDISSSISSFVSERAKDIKDAVLNEASEQGLTPDKVSEAAQTVGQKAKSVLTPGTKPSSRD